jgi:hypothetical protein
MAQVATVYSVAPWMRSAADVLHEVRPDDVAKRRPSPHDKRVWASVEQSPRKVIRAMFDEALHRDPDKQRRWVVLVDGEPRQLRAVKAEARRAGVKVTILLDVVHVLEYVWKAARALFGGSNVKAEKWVGDRLLALLTGRTGGQVAHTIRWWGSRKKLDAPALAAIESACDYVADRTRTRLMNYADALRDGLPIATGVIEGVPLRRQGSHGSHRRALVAHWRRGHPPPPRRESLRRLRRLLGIPPRARTPTQPHRTLRQRRDP